MIDTTAAGPWPVGGYAPGDYWCSCRSCEGKFIGDKRAYTCPDCTIQTIRTAAREQAAEIERLGRELNRAKYGEPDFAWEAHHAAMVVAKAEIERLHFLLAEKALGEMVQAGEDDGLLNEAAEIERLRGLLSVALDAIYYTTDELSLWLEASEYLVKAGFDMGETEHAVSHGMGVSMKIRQALNEKRAGD